VDNSLSRRSTSVGATEEDVANAYMLLEFGMQRLQFMLLLAAKVVLETKATSREKNIAHAEANKPG
jgi:hypothetical protein